jgi:hypothetical protein
VRVTRATRAAGVAARAPTEADILRNRLRGVAFALKRQTEEEHAMKLTSAQLERTLTQFDAKALPDSHPAVPQLNNVFGEHTFFIDGSGLSIVEPAAPGEAGEPTGQVVNLANWSDANLTKLAPHEPEPTDIVIVFAPNA